MQIVNKEKPIKLCQCRPGDTVKLPDSEDVFLVCVFGQPPRLHRTLTSTGLYSVEAPLFLVSLSTGEAIPMPHLSSQMRVVKSFVTISLSTDMSRTEFDPPHLRGTGRTTKQMQGAPKGAIYVWVNQYTGWPRDLAASLGRDDLVIVPPAYLGTIDKLAGRPVSGIVLDHAARLTDRQFDTFCLALTRVR